MTAFDPKTVKLAAACEVPGALFAVALDENRKALYGAGTDGHLYTVDLSAAKPAAKQTARLHNNYVSSLTIRKDELISAGYDRQIIWSELPSGKRIRAVSAHEGWVRNLALTSNGERLVSIGDDMRVKVWDAATGKSIAALADHDSKTPEGYLSAIYALAVSPDGQHIATGDRAGFVRVWAMNADKPIAVFRAVEFYTFDPKKRARAIGGVRGLAFSPDGSRLGASGIGAVTNVDGFVGPCRIELWDWKAAKRIAVGQDKHQAILNRVAFGPEKAWLVAVGGGDGGGALAFWDAAGTTPLHVAKPKGHLHDFALVCDKTRLFAGGFNGFQLWNLSTSDPR